MLYPGYIYDTFRSEWWGRRGKVFLLEERYFKGKTFICDLAKYPRALFLFQCTMKIVISLTL